VANFNDFDSFQNFTISKFQIHFWLADNEIGSLGGNQFWNSLGGHCCSLETLFISGQVLPSRLIYYHHHHSSFWFIFPQPQYLIDQLTDFVMEKLMQIICYLTSDLLLSSKERTFNVQSDSLLRF
jgi:hypothetical protein